jgi:hypothetical protein
MCDKVLCDSTSSWPPNLTWWVQINFFFFEVKLHLSPNDNFFFLVSCVSPFYYTWHEVFPTHFAGLKWRILGRKIEFKLHEIRPFIVELVVLYLSSVVNLMKVAFDVDRNACATYSRFSWVMWLWLWFCLQNGDRLVLRAWNWSWVDFNEY